jgi:hypothetical protein
MHDTKPLIADDYWLPLHEPLHFGQIVSIRLYLRFSRRFLRHAASAAAIQLSCRQPRHNIATLIAD